MRRAAGFTLIELAVVLLILSMLIGTASKNMQGMLPAAVTEAAAREILGTMDFARTQAVARGYPYAVIFDLDEQRYAIRTPFDTDGNPVEDPFRQAVLGWKYMREGSVLVALLDDTGERREKGTWPLYFHPAGDSTDFWAYVGHEASELHLVSVRVLGLTGLATLMQGEVLPQALTENDF
jgi:prepilin-type N-terminal cleavage/methylation domain-containing protein